MLIKYVCDSASDVVLIGVDHRSCSIGLSSRGGL
jgi:hypothetical protein